MNPNKFLKGRPCIYGIRNIINGKIYVGKTKCIYKRCYQYIYDFNTRKLGHLNDYLYSSISKNGIENFEMFVLEFAPISKLSSFEYKWIIGLKSMDHSHGYNLRLDTSTGMIASKETSLKISKNLRKQWSSGVRDGHSEKLKKSWSNDKSRRKNQSVLFSQLKTKYEYEITHPTGEIEVCNYSKLVKLGLKNVLATFHHKKSNDVFYKCFRIVRYNKGER